MLQVSQLFIYPIKSLGGIAKQWVDITPTGFKHDRRWMLVDEQALFLSQRTHPQMALLQTSETEKGIIVRQAQNPSQFIEIPFERDDYTDKIKVTVWEDNCDALLAGRQLNEWFSHMLQINCRLVYMPDDTKRWVDDRYASNQEVTSFSDGYPIMMLGQSSLDVLNQKLMQALPMDRFRPNIVFTGGPAHLEDEMARFSINDIHFLGVKPSSRCVITCINQQTAQKGKEPLQTLATYRMKNNKIYFGQNILHQQNGRIATGDEITITLQKEKFI
jgi:uncharacterized protein YcbX